MAYHLCRSAFPKVGGPKFHKVLEFWFIGKHGIALKKIIKLTATLIK